MCCLASGELGVTSGGCGLCSGAGSTQGRRLAFELCPQPEQRAEREDGEHHRGGGGGDEQQHWRADAEEDAEPPPRRAAGRAAR